MYTNFRDVEVVIRVPQKEISTIVRDLDQMELDRIRQALRSLQEVQRSLGMSNFLSDYDPETLDFVACDHEQDNPIATESQQIEIRNRLTRLGKRLSTALLEAHLTIFSGYPLEKLPRDAACALIDYLDRELEEETRDRRGGRY